MRFHVEEDRMKGCSVTCCVARAGRSDLKVFVLAIPSSSAPSLVIMKLYPEVMASCCRFPSEKAIPQPGTSFMRCWRHVDVRSSGWEGRHDHSAELPEHQDQHLPLGAGTQLSVLTCCVMLPNYAAIMALIHHALKMLFIDLMWILLPSFITGKYLIVIEIQYGAINHSEYEMLTLNCS